MESVLAPMGGGDGVSVPVVDIEETEDAWIIEAEVLAVDGMDVNVDMHASELVISKGERLERQFFKELAAALEHLTYDVLVFGGHGTNSRISWKRSLSR